jgi:osmotically-inducible protein OsmY
MRPGTIYVMASSGNVMLHGVITNPSIKQQANQIARAVPGVRNVTDSLRVVRGAGAYPSYGYVPGQGAQTQYIAESGQPTSSQSDMTLAQQVAVKLRQQLPGMYNVQIETPGTIYVKVSNGTVTLDGFVSNNDAKRNAEQIAKSISGVQNVKNSLSIVGINETLGYPPADEDQSANQNQQFDDQQFGNQDTNQQFGNQQSDDQSGADQPDDGTN